jgi:flagellar biosynthetic protein FliQ
MTPETVVEIIRQALLTAFWLSAPLLLIGFVAGVAISLIQIVTSIQDTAFGTVPRLAAFVAGMLLLMPWMLNKTMGYTVALFSDFARYAR